MTASSPGDLEGVHNFRAVASYALRSGGHLRPGMLYRSGALELMTLADAALLNEIGIATVLDLRHPDEFSPSHPPHHLSDFVCHISIFPETSTQQAMIDELNGLYGTGPTPGRYLHYLEPGGPQFARAFERFADEASYPILVHCTAGKDRTGVLLALVMSVVGVSDEDIAEDYGLSTASVERLIAYMQATGRDLQGTPEEVFARLATPPERMAGFLELLRERYGSAEAYLAGQGVSESTITRVRDLLTAP